VNIEMLVPEKTEPSITWSEAGRQIDCNDEQSESASDPIRASLDPNSNMHDLSDVQLSKELRPRNSTEAGRQNDFNDEQRQSAYAPIPVSLDSNSNATN
jgi:hypothetical protein